MCFIIFNIFIWFKTWYVSFFFNTLIIISTDPAKITGLRVKGHETNGTYLTNENQEVKISCSFTNGNPPVGVRIVDGSSNILSSTKHEEDPLVLSLGPYRCHEVWPIIRCEAPGSELNRSVSIFVKCKFEFLLTKHYVLNKRNTSKMKFKKKNNPANHCHHKSSLFFSPSGVLFCFSRSTSAFLHDYSALELENNFKWRSDDCHEVLYKRDKELSNDSDPADYFHQGSELWSKRSCPRVQADRDLFKRFLDWRRDLDAARCQWVKGFKHYLSTF